MREIKFDRLLGSAVVLTTSTVTNLNAIIAALSPYAPFDDMARSDLEFLAGKLTLASYPVGAAIVDAGAGPPDRIFIIRDGAVEVVTGATRAEAAPLVLHSGECFPLGAVLEGRAVTRQYRASLETRCYALPKAAFGELLQRSPPFRSFCTERVRHLHRQVLTGQRAAAALHGGELQPLNLRLDEIVQRSPLTCPPEQPIREVLETLHREAVGSMLITAADGRPIGIFTARDVLDRVALAEVPLTARIDSVMSPNPVVLPSNAFGFEAALKMSEHGIRHVIVTRGGQVAGLVSERDLFALQRVGISPISAAIGQAGSMATLAGIARDIHALGRNLLAQGVDAEHLAQILTALNDRLTQRVIALELDRGGANRRWRPTRTTG